MGGTVLVTGGAGYVGSHACKALRSAGYFPVAYDSLEKGHESAVRWGPLERGELSDAARLDEVIRRHRPSAAMHFAAYAYVGESVLHPDKYYCNNVAGTLGLLDALRRGGVDRLVFSSTCATFGTPEVRAIDEDVPQRPINPYGASKLMVERILADYAAAYGFGSVALRYFNAAGADPEAEIGEDHEPETHLIPLALDAVMGRRGALTVFGSDYPTPDGTCVRDYVHVTDLADAHVRALRYLEGGGATCALNLGTGRGWSVDEVLDAVREVTGRAVPMVRGARRAGDPPYLVADATRAGQVLGWAPRFADIRQQVEHAWRWHQRRFAAPAAADGGKSVPVGD